MEPKRPPIGLLVSKSLKNIFIENLKLSCGTIMVNTTRKNTRLLPLNLNLAKPYAISAHTSVWIRAMLKDTRNVVKSAVKYPFSVIMYLYWSRDGLFEIRNDKIFVDLKEINKRQLEEIGIEKIDVCPYCTVHNNDLFYSYRNENGTGKRHSAVLKLG